MRFPFKLWKIAACTTDPDSSLPKKILALEGLPRKILIARENTHCQGKYLPLEGLPLHKVLSNVLLHLLLGAPTVPEVSFLCQRFKDLD